MFTRRHLAIIVTALLLVLAACGDDSGGDTGTNEGPTTTLAQPDGGDASTDTFTRSENDSSPLPEGAATTAAAPAAPQRVEFMADDGHPLVGYFYPAAVSPAPTVVLMHWAGGDQRDWLAIAPWLQNRQAELPQGWESDIGAGCGPVVEGPWLDPTWFPPMPPDASYAVFTFDFRKFCESLSGAGSDDLSELALDAKAAFDTAAGLEGVDPSRMVAIGASIGADGAVDGCVLHNRSASTCLGGFSLSPGDYLMGEHYPMSYVDSVTELDAAQPPIPVWCLAAEQDGRSPEKCRAASGQEYRAEIYPGGDHGMTLIVADIEPNPLTLIQEFLESAFGMGG